MVNGKGYQTPRPKGKRSTSSSRKLGKSKVKKEKGKGKEYAYTPRSERNGSLSARFSRLMRETTREGSSDVATAALSSVSSDQTININVQVNPMILGQYIWGVLGRALSSTDRPEDHNAMINYFWQTVTNFENTNSLYWVLAPRAICALRKSLEPRRIRKYYYSPEFIALRNAISASNTSTKRPINFEYWGFNIGTLATPTTEGFGVEGTYPMQTNTEVSGFISQFSSTLDLCAYDSVREDYGDASGFAFASEQPFDDHDRTGDKVVYTIGKSSTLTDRFAVLSQVGVNALETPIRRKWLARIGVCTQVYRYAAIPNDETGPQVPVDRLPNYTVSRTCPPSLLGWNSTVRTAIPGKLQLKPVPTTRTHQHLVSRLEAVGKLLGGAWTTPLSSSDVKMWAHCVLRAYAARYSGAYAGVKFLVNAVANLPMTPEYHVGMGDILPLKITEPMARLLGALLPSGPHPTTLIPLLFTYSPESAVTTLEYTVPPIIIPSAEISNANYYKAQDLAAILRPLEGALAQFVNMSSQTKLGPSLLDVSYGLGVTGGGVLKLTSRRPLTEEVASTVMSSSPAIGYFGTSDSAVANTLFGQSGNLAYGEGYVKILSGRSSLTQMTNSTVNEGIVNNGFTSNIAENTGTGRPVPLPLQGPSLLTQKELHSLPPEKLDFIKKWAQRLVPRAGNYCGPGWTAGVDTAEMSILVDNAGQFVVAPTSAEDAICKVHDEAYHRAMGDKFAIREADLAMVRALEKLPSRSWYGHAAAIAIREKAGLYVDRDARV